MPMIDVAFYVDDGRVVAVAAQVVPLPRAYLREHRALVAEHHDGGRSRRWANAASVATADRSRVCLARVRAARDVMYRVCVCVYRRSFQSRPGAERPAEGRPPFDGG